MTGTKKCGSMRERRICGRVSQGQQSGSGAVDMKGQNFCVYERRLTSTHLPSLPYDCGDFGYIFLQEGVMQT